MRKLLSKKKKTKIVNNTTTNVHSLEADFLFWSLWWRETHPLFSDKNGISSSSITPRKPSISVGMWSSLFWRTKSIDNPAVTENSEITLPHVIVSSPDLNKSLPNVVSRTAVSSGFSKQLGVAVSCLDTFVYIFTCIVSRTEAACKIRKIISFVF